MEISTPNYINEATQECDAASLYIPRFSRDLLAPRYWPVWLGIGLLRLLACLPARWRAGVGALLGELVYLVHAKRREIVRINLRLCFPDMPSKERRRLARRHYRLYAQSLMDYGLLWWGSAEKLARTIKVTGMEHYQQARAQGRSVIVLTGHFVGLEMGAAMLCMHFPQIGLIKPTRNALLNWYISRGRTRFKGKLVMRKKGMRPIVRAIKQGCGFYYLPDEDHGHKKSLFAPFFATQAATLNAPAKLASLCNAVVIPSFTRRLPGGGGYELVFRPPLQGFPSGNECEDVKRINQELEASIKQDPAQYMWTFKMFKTRCDSQASPYARCPRRK